MVQYDIETNDNIGGKVKYHARPMANPEALAAWFLEIAASMGEDIGGYSVKRKGTSSVGNHWVVLNYRAGPMSYDVKVKATIVRPLAPC